MDYSIFLKPELLILVAFLVFIGMMIKQIKKIPDEFIPLILGIFGAIVACLMEDFSIQSIIQGVLAAACAVSGNQTVKQIIKYKNTDSESALQNGSTYDNIIIPNKTEEK